MTDPRASDRDVSRAIRSWLHEDRHEDASRVAGAVLDQVEATPRRRVTWWPARRTPFMSKFVSLGLGAAAVVVALVIGFQFLGPAAPGGVGGAPATEPTATPSPPPIGGTVEYQWNGAPATTEVDAVADGASVSGMAITTFSTGTHTVRLECAARDGDTWAFGGTVEQTTLPGERTGPLSAVLVKDGSPQQIAIWASEQDESDCDAWLTSGVLADPRPADWFQPVESGALVPPPDLAP